MWLVALFFRRSASYKYFRGRVGYQVTELWTALPAIVDYQWEKKTVRDPVRGVFKTVETLASKAFQERSHYLSLRQKP